MGPLSDWDSRLDILSALAGHGMLHILEMIFCNLKSADLRSVRLVSSAWLGLVHQLIQHKELCYLSTRWTRGQPKVEQMQCKRERSVCTITALAVDATTVAVGLGSCGKIEVWNRRTLVRDWELQGHKEGVYTLQLGRYIVVSGGEDGTVKVWSRDTGDLLSSLDHHTYIVWSVKLCLDQLVTASYDCTVCYLHIQESENQFISEVINKVQGPWEWADALYLGDAGDILVVHEEDTHTLHVWDIEKQEILSRLSGHQDEVHSVSVRGSVLVSGGSDRTVLVWCWRSGGLLARLAGHEGKVWSVGIDRSRIASGGRFGEVRVWNYPGLENLINQETIDYSQGAIDYSQGAIDNNQGAIDNSQETIDNNQETTETKDKNTEITPLIIKDSRVLLLHPRSTSVSALHIDSFCLLTGDGLATINQWDFWDSVGLDQQGKQYNTPVPDPLLADRTPAS